MDKRRADIIAEELEQLILTSGFSDGERLDEIKLAERFGVSRTPLREAFQKLATSGLVNQVPRRGVFVRQPGPVELLQMFEVMAELEAACGRFAALRISDEALEQLEQANLKCQTAVSEQNASEYYIENERFHHLIYAQSGNAFLEQEALRLHRRLKPYRRLQLKLRGRMRQSMDEHNQIVRALRDGDADRAARALRDHVAVQGEKFQHLMAGLKTAAA
ncbi:HTH-type transcriptional repressor RspR (plasmid) [Pseudoseohaeicola sp. NH-UV-7]|uniref:GntR family transcriptional regulator n=1 Tax=unclassified Sulfitobacter TaxID=196795 RepID=UPI000E0BAA77|nr:GntR family transcriptional regulator [Sulfitobacter sp. JL08]AXI54317.1 GntR family transcriptional regulator [Sulfitobacter sp. JL08]